MIKGVSTKPIGSLRVNCDKPTELTFDELSDWVLWQFPRLRVGWLCGAAHPADPEFGWIPTRIQPTRRRAILYAHCTKPFSTPEEAAEWIENFSDSER